MVSPELQGWLQQVSMETEAGTIKWKSPNPTTYFWDTTTPKAARVVLQRVERKENFQPAPGRVSQRTVVQYILTATDQTKPQIPEVTLNGSLDSDLNALLDSLYLAISKVITRDTVTYLRSLLPGNSPST
jgi:hypothetical protein